MAMEVGEISKQCAYDISMRDYLLGRMEKGDTIVAGVFHRPDSNGHLAGFANENPHYVNAVRNADLYLCDLLECGRAAGEAVNEKWTCPRCGGPRREQARAWEAGGGAPHNLDGMQLSGRAKIFRRPL